MSAFGLEIVSELAEIRVKASRGIRQSLQPFDDKLALQEALQRAERAYFKALEQLRFEAHYKNLRSVFEEQRRFAQSFSGVVRAWNQMTELAQKDLASEFEWFSAVDELGQNEELLAVRPHQPVEVLVAKLDRIVRVMHKTADKCAEAELVIPAGKKKDRLDQKTTSALRAFAYELKLHWDEVMRKSIGLDFAKRFAFSVAHEFVFKAIASLTTDYTKLDVARIMRSLQSANYDPNKFRLAPPDNIGVFKYLRPQLVFPARGKG
ncbi:hypothetical protein JQ609_11340 [Bradyrhizobium sp. AUGA SZCCT0169]|uniref:hypothetical protein n=1 Tax=Bradyrhizobium sp. AUGA SZCCT0169 TaxID=2807663 RepID=UPI001BAE270B|nr:hypothetical protein [Bradyrhizobium sp. AUGA SZCCT0169]MBR1247528.1 hypothetical protein [Bradyrhizobium sp. AUGA SZCCT0169]